MYYTKSLKKWPLLPTSTLIVASKASDPTFETIYFQYYTLVALIQINTSGTVRRRRRRRRRRSRFQGVETPPKPIHISKNRLCRMKAGSAKGAQFHLLVNICHSFFSMTVFLFFLGGEGWDILLGLAQQWNAHPVGQSSSPLLPAVTFFIF